jgi:hypothetical protein
LPGKERRMRRVTLRQVVAAAQGRRWVPVWRSPIALSAAVSYNCRLPAVPVQRDRRDPES